MKVIQRLYHYYWVDTSAGGLVVSKGIIRPVVSDVVLTWFIKLFLLLKFTAHK